MGSSSRHLARELVLQALYAGEIGDRDPGDSLESLAAESGINDKHLGFARELLTLTQRFTSEADPVIAELSENWKLERIAVIDRLILRMALTEIRHRLDTPEKVVLNEALELAKTYSTAQSHQFINGILDRAIHQRRADAPSGPDDKT
jgi:N utilization substance protein B